MNGLYVGGKKRKDFVTDNLKEWDSVHFTWRKAAGVALVGTDHCWRWHFEVDHVFCFLYQTLQTAGKLVLAAM